MRVITTGYDKGESLAGRIIFNVPLLFYFTGRRYFFYFFIETVRIYTSDVDINPDYLKI